jgi:hypothetical protein
MNRKTYLTREQHLDLGTALRRTHSDIIALRQILCDIGPINSRAAKAAVRMDRALLSVRSALDAIAVPMWPGDETREALGIYFGYEPPSPEMSKVRDAIKRGKARRA